MNSLLIEGLIGALLALPLIVFLWRRTEQSRRVLLSISLMVAVLIYIVFAGAGLVTGKADSFWMVTELAGIFLFGPLAYLGWRKGLFYVGAGWAFHIFWDLVVHNNEAFVPAFYPGLCFGFDLVVALFTFYWLIFDNRE